MQLTFFSSSSATCTMQNSRSITALPWCRSTSFLGRSKTVPSGRRRHY